MEATQIITIAQAKNWLSAPDDTDLERLIKSSLNFVEKYTGYTLISKDVTIQIPTYGYGISTYPMEILSVKNSAGNTINYKTDKGIYNTYIFAPVGSYVAIKAGYTSLDEIPGMLIEVAYKMMTYLYENRDIYPATLPLDYQMMVNKYRRNLV